MAATGLHPEYDDPRKEMGPDFYEWLIQREMSQWPKTELINTGSPQCTNSGSYL